MFNKPFSVQVEFIKKLHQTYNFKTVVAEYSGLGISPSEDLKQVGLPIEFFKPTVDAKEGAYNLLLKSLEDESLTIPNYQKLQYELRTFTYKITEAGKTKLHHISGGSDDFCDALCFSNWAAKKGPTVIFDFGDVSNGDDRVPEKVRCPTCHYYVYEPKKDEKGQYYCPGCRLHFNEAQRLWNGNE